MAKGTPDWIESTDVILQTLDVLAARIKRGFTKLYSYDDTVAAAGNTLLVSIIGKGTIINIVGHIDDTAQIDDDRFFMLVDGETIPDITVADHRNIGTPSLLDAITNMGKIDDVNYIYTWVLSRVVTFEESFYGYFQEAHGRTPTVTVFAVVGTY